MKKLKTERFELKLTPEQKQALESLAQQLDKTASEVVREFVDAISRLNEIKLQIAKEIVQEAWQMATANPKKCLQLNPYKTSQEYLRVKDFEPETAEQLWKQYLTESLAQQFAKIIENKTVNITNLINKIEEQIKNL